MIATPTPPEPEMHTSPDGLIALTILPEVDGDVMVGFHGFDWAITTSQLAGDSDIPEDQALKQFVHAVLSDQALIAVLFHAGEMVDIWVTSFPKSDLEFCEDDERILFRYWSGKVVDPSDI